MGKITTNKIEEVLLKRELDSIVKQIEKLAPVIEAIFSPYHNSEKGMTSDFEESLNEFIKKILFAKSIYYSGLTTKGTARVHPDWVPDELKKAILATVTKEFVERVANIEEIASECARQ